MEISAKVRTGSPALEVAVTTDERRQTVALPAKTGAPGSAINGGELLMLALATCYLNDLHREASRLGIPIEGVEVEASARFPGVGLSATDIRYRARISSSAGPEVIADLLRQTDAVAEVHNTIRAGVPVTLETVAEER
jgi:organic hydroperoxide reductase OsmC/OhrA